MTFESLQGPGLTGRDHPTTSHAAASADRATHRLIVVQIILPRGPEGANAYEVWREWDAHPQWWGPAPTLNNVNSRIGELLPNRPRHPGTKYRAPDGRPYLWWTPRKHPTPTKEGHVVVAYQFAKTARKT